MTTEIRTFLAPPQLAIAEGATTPDPGGTAARGAIVWSTTLSAVVRWSGTAWNAMASGGGDLITLESERYLTRVTANNNGGTLVTTGSGVSLIGSASANDAFNFTTLHQSLPAIRFIPALNTQSGWQDTAALVARGGANAGGFMATWLFGTGTVTTDRSFLCGLTSDTFTTSGVNSSGAANFFGLEKETFTANWLVSRRTGSGAVTKVNTGVAFADGQVISLRISALRNASDMSIEAKIHTGSSNTTIISATYNTVLPTATTGLRRVLTMFNAAAGTGVLKFMSSHLMAQTL